MILIPKPIVPKTQRYGATRSKAARRAAVQSRKDFLAKVKADAAQLEQQTAA